MYVKYIYNSFVSLRASRRGNLIQQSHPEWSERIYRIASFLAMTLTTFICHSEALRRISREYETPYLWKIPRQARNDTIRRLLRRPFSQWHKRLFLREGEGVLKVAGVGPHKVGAIWINDFLMLFGVRFDQTEFEFAVGNNSFSNQNILGSDNVTDKINTAGNSLNKLFVRVDF